MEFSSHLHLYNSCFWISHGPALSNSASPSATTSVKKLLSDWTGLRLGNTSGSKARTNSCLDWTQPAVNRVRGCLSHSTPAKNQWDSRSGHLMWWHRCETVAAPEKHKPALTYALTLTKKKHITPTGTYSVFGTFLSSVIYLHDSLWWKVLPVEAE